MSVARVPIIPGMNGSSVVARRLLDAGDVPVASLDDEGRLTAANPAFTRLCGRPAGELVGLHVLALCPGHDQADVLAAVVRVLGGVSPVEHADLHVLAADGTERTARLTMVAVEGPDGRVSGIDTVAQPARPMRERRRAAAPDRARRSEQPATSTALHVVDGRGLELLVVAASRRAGRSGRPFGVLHCLTDRPGTGELHAAVAARLRQILRPGDTVAPAADGTITVVAEDLRDGQDAAGVAYRLLSAVVTPVRTVAGEVPVAMSVGISVGTGTEAAGDLVADAQRAADEAARDGGGGFRIAPHAVVDVVGG
jgi:diguanylate cyclase